MRNLSRGLTAALTMPVSVALHASTGLIGLIGSGLVLRPLTLSASTFRLGVPASGTINGATAGSAITAADLPSGLTIDGAARTWTWSGAGSASTGNLTLAEALAGATNSPRDSVIGWEVEAAPSATVTAMVMGQSELEYLFNASSFYRQIAQPTPGDGNLVVITQGDAGAAPVRTEVNATTVAAGQVNPAMAALSALLAHAAPTVQFVVGDGAVAGTARPDLGDDTTDGTEAPSRQWNDFAAVASQIETEFGSVGHLIENWYNADRGQITTFKASFWPLYFGAFADGSAFTLGGTHNGREVDHCIWDASAATSAKGRGLFARDTTKWSVITPMPFQNAPVSPDPEWSNFSSTNPALSEPARATMIALADDTLAQSVGIEVGPSSHLTKFGGGSSEIHPDISNADGQVLFTWPIAVALLRAAGMSIGEPMIVNIEGPIDGSYADLVVDLPNGGDLTTLAALRSASYSGSAPHQQDVTGIELTRASDSTRRPIFRTTETSYPSSHRGTVTIVDAGSGSPRRGRIRITPEEPFAAGDALSFLRGQATAALLEPRDFDLYPWFPIEHVASLYDASATYPMEGIPVRPYQEDIVTLAEGGGDPDPGGDPTEWLVTDGGWLVDPVNVPAGTSRITFRGKLRFASVSGLFYPFSQESTACDFRVSNGTLLTASVEDGAGTVMLPSTSQFAGATLETGTWYDIVFDVDQVARQAVLTIDGTDYTLAFSGPAGTGTFQSTREVSFLGTSGGTSLVPAGTEFADLSVEFNGVVHKAISNDAVTANTDSWKGGPAFTQGV